MVYSDLSVDFQLDSPIVIVNIVQSLYLCDFHVAMFRLLQSVTRTYGTL